MSDGFFPGPSFLVHSNLPQTSRNPFNHTQRGACGMNSIELFCNECEIPIASIPGGPVGLLECPQCHTQVEVPVLLDEDGVTPVAITDLLLRAEQKVEDLRTQLSETEQRVAQTANDENDITGLVARMQMRINELNLERAELRSELTKARSGAAPSTPTGSSDDGKKAGARIELLEKELALAQENIQRLEKETAESAEGTANFERALAASAVDLREKSAEIDQLRPELDSLKGEANRLRDENVVLRRDAVELRSNLESLTSERDSLRHALDQAGGGAAQSSAELSQIKAELAQTRLELLGAKEIATNREVEHMELRSKLDRAEKEVERLRASLTETDTQHDRVVGELIDIKRSFALLSQQVQEARQEVVVRDEYIRRMAEQSIAGPASGVEPVDAPPPPDGGQKGAVKVLGSIRRSS